jgi:hypothetical protein
MSALAKVWVALCAISLLAPVAYALASGPTPTQTQAGGADAGLPRMPDMSMRPTASAAR